MDPQLSREPALRLPRPVAEQAAWASASNIAPEGAPAQEAGPQASQTAPASIATPAPLLSAPTQQISAQPHQPLVAPSQTAVAVAGDDASDERVWVERAKRIIEQTHADPFVESREIGKFKAEYLKDVHAKNIKVAEG